MAVKRWVVEGRRYTAAGRWEPFEEAYEGETRAEARWNARRDQAPGEPVADIEAMPPNPEREVAEVADADNPRDTTRSAEESAEYDRLVDNVVILSVEEAS